MLNLTSKGIKKLVQDNNVQMAIAHASPSLFRELNKWLAGDISDIKRINRLELSLYKYISRMSARATPFGMLSTIGYIENKEQNRFIIENSKIITKRLDICSLKLLISYFQKHPALKDKLRFRSNNTIYKISDKIRYFHATTRDNSIDYELIEVKDNVALQNIVMCCSEDYKTIDELCSNFEGEKFIKRDVINFISELIESSILVCEFDELLVAPNAMQLFLTLLREKLPFIDKSYEVKFQRDIENVERILLYLEDETILISEAQKEILNIFNYFKLEPSITDLIHVDTGRTTSVNNQIHIDDILLEELDEVHTLLLNLFKKEFDPFSKFKKDFVRRYGNQEMDLLFVLDSELGIGYNHSGEMRAESLLTQGLDIGTSINTSITLSSVEIFLLKKMLECKNVGSSSIELCLNDIKIRYRKNDIFNSKSALFKLLNKGTKIQLEEFSGSSALNLLGRFTHIDTRIKRLGKEISCLEEKKYPNCLFAEVIHIPELKSGNLISLEKLRRFELPCFTNSNNPTKLQIKLSDIKVKISIDNEIVLYSKKHNKRIFPKLSHSLNYNRNSIDIYRFLGDLQYQNQTPVVSFDWSNLKQLFNFFPRVFYKNIILSPATWIVKDNELERDKGDFNSNKFGSWRKSRKIPRYVYLASDIKDDNRLLIDLSNNIGQNVFYKELIKSKKVFLSEMLEDEQFLNKDYYSNEIVLPYICTSSVIETQSSSLDLESLKKDVKINTKCFPGSDWVYYKIYIGYRTADSLLQTIIPNLIRKLRDKDLIRHWFFVRYSDDDFHLRIRFLLNSVNNYEEVIQNINIELQGLVDDRIIHRVVLDTYKREVDRYGVRTISLCEELFTNDSDIICNYIKCQSDISNRWYFGAIQIDSYLNCFDFSLKEKNEILLHIANSYCVEFNIDKNTIHKLNKKYRSYSKILFSHFHNNKSNDTEEALLINNCVDMRINQKNLFEQIRKLVPNKEVLIDIVLSLIHMSLNRLFDSNHRKQELVLYYIMHKFYKSLLAINNKK